MLALSIRQPHAEAILRGCKTIEYRSRSTKIRGRVLIYVPLTIDHDIYGMGVEGLPVGMIVGSVEIIAAEAGRWMLANPIRLKAPRKPTRHPQPVFFRPFNEE